MYSKKQMGYPQRGYSITPPPGYDGSRFRSRSDGRDDAFPPYDNPPQVYAPEKKGGAHVSSENSADNEDIFSFDHPPKSAIKVKKDESFFPFLKKGIGNEELIIIALLIVLISENNISSELVLMLGLLLCI
ncbi:MAG: hypothetical protein J6K92_05430 [Oscillospiraceae bacterium]|nr:hypothetical protein [Oscillospiraceae bacterium]